MLAAIIYLGFIGLTFLAMYSYAKYQECANSAERENWSAERKKWEAKYALERRNWKPQPQGYWEELQTLFNDRNNQC